MIVPRPIDSKIKWIYVELVDVADETSRTYNDKLECGLFSGVYTDNLNNIFIALRKGKAGKTSLYNYTAYDILSIHIESMGNLQTVWIYKKHTDEQSKAFQKLLEILNTLKEQSMLQPCGNFIYTTMYSDIPKDIYKHLEIDAPNETKVYTSYNNYKYSKKPAYTHTYVEKKKEPTFFERKDVNNITLLNIENLKEDKDDNRFIYVEEEKFKSYYAGFHV